MGIAFRQTEINIKIAKKQGKEIAKLLQDKGWIAEDMPLDAAMAAIGWHGKYQKTLLIIDEIDVDKITKQVSEQFEALASFVRDGSFVRFEWWIQPVNATHSSNISAGVLNPSVFLGRWFNCLAIASKLSCE
ncbi:hypothetical protein [Delftia tsuruhatensis]|uniref:hypothetical protein n=1 Tax=Delftia tsuruhatensis TaxID=180282 RepID=UPI0023DC92A1|nr:hypothetical protein [Delftia tsuruhatensis]WEL95764.1 hypothetical protein PW274_16965 [Delftia tsuruhatensis]